MKQRKAAAFCFAFLLAELAAAYLPLPVSVSAAAVFLFCALVLFAARAKLSAVRHWLLPLLGLGLGFGWYLAFFALSVRPALALQNTSASCTVTVETDCAASYAEGSCRGTLTVTELNGRPTHMAVYCAAYPDAEPGDRFAAVLQFSALRADGYRLGRFADGVYLSAEITQTVQTLAPSAAPRFALYTLRKELSAVLGRYLSRREAGMEAAFLLGNKDQLETAVSDAFRTAGVSHLLAVSGLHVAVLCGLLTGAGIKRRFSRPWIAARMGLVLFYMALTGFTPSVLRAGWVFLFAELGFFLLQPPDTITAMGIVALALSLFGGAYFPCDLGFQLSFCAALGVQASAACGGRLRARLGIGAERKRPGEKDWRDVVLKHSLSLWDTTQCAAFAATATLPVLLLHGMAASGAVLLANLLLVWMLRPVLLGGIALLVLAAVPFLAPCAHMLGFVLSVFLSWMYQIAAWCAALPFAKLELPAVYTVFVLGVLALCYLCLRALRLRRWFLPAAALCTLAACLAGTALSRDLVRVALVGSAAAPCAIVTENGSAVVLFRGGAANRRAAEEYLGRTRQTGEPLWIDLRCEPAADTLAEKSLCLAMQEQTVFLSEPQVGGLPDVGLELYHNNSGNLAVLSIKGYHIGMLAGDLKLETPIVLDCFLAGVSYPADLCAGTVLTLQPAPKWLDRVQGETLLWGPDIPCIVLRPGKSVWYQEVTSSFALQ